MTLVYRKGDLIRLTVPTMSGWQGIGIVLEPVHQDDDPDTVVSFRKQGEDDDDATPCIALLSEVEPVAQRHPEPVPVSERLPEPGTKVLAHYFNALGKGRTICAIWVPAKSRSDEGDLDADDFLEYDEEGDKYYWPEGWYEAIENWEELGWVKVYEGEVVYWQPLPKWPALPLPQGEVQP